MPILIDLSAHAVRFAPDTAGTTAIEYALIAGIVAVGMAGVLAVYGSSLEVYFMDIATKVGEV
jgi:Flp pilus assembly pilin Flp